MNVTVFPGPLAGTITPPPSKSQAHRCVIAGALAPGRSVLDNLAPSQDISATIACMRALGAQIDWQGPRAEIQGVRAAPSMPELDCGESGSTLRFLIPVALALAGGGVFRGRGRLMRRPQDPYFAIFQEKGIAFSLECDTLTVRGALTPGVYALPGDVSSQFVTGLLYALPLLPGDSQIVLTSPLESAGYVDMTLDALARFGVTAIPTAQGWAVPGGQRYTPAAVTVEPDYSQAAFFLAAKGCGDQVAVAGLRPDSRQGDRVMLEYGARLDGPGPVALDVRACPDLVPALAVRAALRDGQRTHICNAGRLRLKESDRLRSVTAVLTALGGDVTEEPEGLDILGRGQLPGGGTVDAFNDHRIAMMAAIAGAHCAAPVTITGAECVRKSYPDFWADFQALGGRVEVQA